MTVESRTEEARLLLNAGKLEGAVGLLMIAIAGSSRKVYKKPPYSDNKAFKFFLGGRLRQILLSDFEGPYPTQSNLKIEFNGKPRHLEDIIYEYCRNSILHDATIAPEIEISTQEIVEPNATFISNGTTLNLKFSKTLILDRTWIEVFFQVVAGAKCNNGIAKTYIKKLIPINNDEADNVYKYLASEHRLTPRRINRLKEIVKTITPDTIKEVDDRQLKNIFLAVSKYISARILENLKLRNIVDDEYNLTTKGIDSLRKISVTHHLVDVLDESL